MTAVWSGKSVQRPCALGSALSNVTSAFGQGAYGHDLGFEHDHRIQACAQRAVNSAHFEVDAATPCIDNSYTPTYYLYIY